MKATSKFILLTGSIQFFVAIGWASLFPAGYQSGTSLDSLGLFIFIFMWIPLSPMKWYVESQLILSIFLASFYFAFDLMKLFVRVYVTTLGPLRIFLEKSLFQGQLWHII